jgi:hypothetical protein
MSRTHVTVLLALLVLALSTSTAFAQRFPQGFQGGQNISRAGRATEGDADTCQGTSGGSRVRENCDPGATPAQTGPELKVPVKPSSEQASTSTSATLCEATTLTEYIQRNTTARVNGSVSIKNCPAGSTGTYNVVVRVKDASGEIKPLEFSEKWQGGDAQDVKYTADYPIGENVELLNVRVRNLRCTCAEVAPAPTEASAASQN